MELPWNLQPQNIGRTWAEHVLPMFCSRIFYGNSMNNLLSYWGLIDAKIRASDKDLPVQERKMCQNPAYSKLNQYPLRHMKYQGPSINSREITFIKEFMKGLNFLTQIFPRNQHLKTDFMINLLKSNEFAQEVHEVNLMRAFTWMDLLNRLHMKSILKSKFLGKFWL